MEKFSKNKKLNAVLSSIYEQLDKLGWGEVKHYFDEFKNEPDYNVVQYGNLLIYYNDIKKMYQSCGYKTNFTNSQIWEIYKRQTGYLIRKILQKQ